MEAELKKAAQTINRNVAAYRAGKIDFEQFSATSRAAWFVVSQGEPRIIDSECDRRHQFVEGRLN